MSRLDISVVDLNDYKDSAKRDAFVSTLGKSLEDYGFAAITNHGISKDLLDRTYESAKATFALSEDVKKKYEDSANNRQRGYTSFGVEHAKDSAIPDLKEFWHVGLDLAADDPLTTGGLIPPNIFPEEVPTFRKNGVELYNALEDLAKVVLEAIGSRLDKPAAFFEEMVRGGNNVLRIINYPDMGAEVPAGAIRAAAHEDINLLTLLPASTQPGLELLTREGEWVSVFTPPDVIICDTGDMMQLLSAGQFPATTHRVVNPEKSDGGRMSMPFFMHPRVDYLIEPLKEGYAEPILTGEFLAQRLKEIGL